MILLDGGMGRELSRNGAPFRLPEWSALALIEAPEFVERAHVAFRDAGADVLTTNSYALTPGHLGPRADQAGRLADRAGRIARGVAGTRLVAGSLPPLFGSYQPERFDAARAPALLAPIVEGLAPHVDVFLAETQGSVAEVTAAAGVARGTGRPFWASFALRDEVGYAGPPVLRSGESAADAARDAIAAGAAAVLFNCSQAERMEAAVAAAVAVAGDVAVGAYANAFVAEAEADEPYPGISTLRPDLDPAAYAGLAARWIMAGASILGGCCGIGPEHIAVLRTLLDTSRARPATPRKLGAGTG